MSSSLVDLRFSDVEPPAEEPARVIYCDIVDLPDPLIMGLGVRVYNLDSVALYMQVEGIGDDWIFTVKSLGLVAGGDSLIDTLTSFGSRSRPSAGTRDTIMITVNAYTDAGYLNLKWSRSRNMSVEYLKSDDGSWSINESSNFDDGTVQGWALDRFPGGGWVFGVATSYVLSYPYALRAAFSHTSSINIHERNFYQTFDSPARDRVFAITNLMLRGDIAQPSSVYFEVNGVATLACQFGPSQDTWLRMIVPLPPGTDDVVLKVGWTWWNTVWGNVSFWMDDFKIISKAIDAPTLDLSNTEGIAFYWWGSGGLDQQIEFEVESPTGSWVGKFYDGPALWRWVFLRWSDLTAVDLDGSRPDRSNVTGIFWTYHTDGVRRINYIVGWRKQDVYGHVVIRQPTSVDLYAHVAFIRSIELYAHAIIRNIASVNLPATFEVGQDSADLLCKFEIGQYSADLLAKFMVAQFQVSLREHKNYAAYNPNWVYSKPSSSKIRGTSSTPALGRSYFFVNVSREWLHGKYIRITWRGDYTAPTWGTQVYIYDGAYNRASDVDFPFDSGLLIKGNGLLQQGLMRTGDFSMRTEEFQVDVSGGSEDMVMIAIQSNDSWSGASGYYEVEVLEINSGPGGVGTLYHEPFKAAINMERTGTFGDYGYISEGELPQTP